MTNILIQYVYYFVQIQMGKAIALTWRERSITLKDIMNKHISDHKYSTYLYF